MADKYTPPTNININKLMNRMTSNRAEEAMSGVTAAMDDKNTKRNSKIKQQVMKEENQLLKDQVESQKKLNEYTNANLAGKQKILKSEIEQLKSQKEQLEILRQITEDKKEQAQIDEYINSLNDEIKIKNDMTIRQQEELKRVLYENGSVKEKLAAQEAEHAEKLKRQKEEELKIQEKIAEARAKEDKESEKRYQKELEDTKEKHKKENSGNALAALKLDLGNLFNGGEGGKGFKSIGSDILSGLAEGDKLGSAVGGAMKIAAPNFISAFAASPWAKLAIEGIKLIASGIANLQKKLDEGVDKAVKVQTSYLGKINSRLMGSSDSFAKFQNDLGASFGKSAFISQQNLMKTIADMVEKGIAFNVEERAIFQELKDSMVSTFDAFAGELPRLIRLQQTDMTAGQMGFEALLTQFLNKNFQDTSYLSDVYDSISSSLIDAASQLTAEGAAEFNFAVQKWLGSLYSLGMSESGVSKIAQGINYLATGNVEALNSDEGLRTLFASAAGNTYSQILTGGLNAATVNDLLSNIVVYLKGISKDTNQVTKQALAGAFGGLSFSDLRALNNMSDSIIASIYDNNKGYREAMQETYNQFMNATTVFSSKDLSTNARVSPAQLFETAYENILYEYGIGVASDFKKYNTFRMASQLEDTGKLGKIAGGIVKLFSNIVSDFQGDKQGGIESLFNMIDVEFSSADRYKNLFLNSDMISSMMNDLRKNNIVTRGDAATLASLADTNTLTGFSVMSRLNLTPGGGGITDFSSSSAATATQTTTTGEAISRGVSDLYAELFERQTTSMKVSLDSIGGVAVSTLSNIIDLNTKSAVGIQNVSEDALRALSQAMKTDVLESIDDKLSGTIQVSGQEDFVSTINSGLAYARGI